MTASSVNDNLGGLKEATASCPSGKRAIGGGSAPVSSLVATWGFPTSDGKSWRARGYISPGAFYSVTAYAICAKVAG